MESLINTLDGAHSILVRFSYSSYVKKPEEDRLGYNSFKGMAIYFFSPWDFNRSLIVLKSSLKGQKHP